MNEVLQAVLNEKIIVICRGLYNEELHSTVEALFKGGIRCFEVTFDQSDSDCENKTFNAIRMLVEYFPEAYIGAGTVITKSQLMKAYDAGAKYIISPNTNASIIEQTKKLGLLSVPGATTPSEILQAHEYGAD